MRTQESRNHTATKFAAFVHVVCDTMCTKLCSKRTTSYSKKVKIPMDPRSMVELYPSQGQ